MESDDIGHRCCKQAKWIVISKIGLYCKRQVFKVIKRFYRVRMHALLIEALLIHRNVFINTLGSLAQPLKLQLLQFFARHALAFFIPYHVVLPC
jgi:hypothetical protein